MPAKTAESRHTKLVDHVMQLNHEFRGVLVTGVLPQWVAVDLTFSQLKALILLAHHNALTVSDLARLLGTGKPATSILVHQLVQKSFVRRTEDERDRRRTLVRLTPRGVDLMVGQRENITQALTRWVNQLDNAELTSFAHGLEALIRVVRAEQAQDETRPCDPK